MVVSSFSGWFAIVDFSALRGPVETYGQQHVRFLLGMNIVFHTGSKYQQLIRSQVVLLTLRGDPEVTLQRVDCHSALGDVRR